MTDKTQEERTGTEQKSAEQAGPDPKPATNNNSRKAANSNIKKTTATTSPSSKGIFTAGFGVLLFLIPLLVVTLSLFEIDGAVVAPGTLIIEGKPKVVQHLDGGIVKEIHLTDGDHAKEGDLILKLDDVLLNANIEIYSNRLRTAVAKKARLMAEREEAPTITWTEDLLAILEVPRRP